MNITLFTEDVVEKNQKLYCRNEDTFLLNIKHFQFLKEFLSHPQASKCLLVDSPS